MPPNSKKPDPVAAFGATARKYWQRLPAEQRQQIVGMGMSLLADALGAGANGHAAPSPSDEVPAYVDAAMLGVKSTASVAEIKSAYKRRAAELHPDKGGDAEAFAALKASYDRLMARAT